MLTNTALTSLLPNRLNAAKFAFTTRRVPRSAVRGLVAGQVTPRSGDLVLARVDTIGQHPRVELVDGRKAILFVGDEVVVCYGARYAPDQFEAEVPADLAPCDLVAAGGLAGRMVNQHLDMDEPTRLSPVGLLVDEYGEPLNVDRWALGPQIPTDTRRPYTLLTVGTAMNSGKTTTGAHLVRGLVEGGHRVGTAKVTGTGAGNDLWIMRDAGADVVLDFTDAGLASTYRAPAERLEWVFDRLTAELAGEGVDVAVIEVADGLAQAESAALLRSTTVAAITDGVLFSAGDALGAAAGVEWLRQRGLPVLGVGGLLTASPLAVREAARVTELPVLGREQLSNPAVLAAVGISPMNSGRVVSLAPAGEGVPA